MPLSTSDDKKVQVTGVASCAGPQPHSGFACKQLLLPWHLTFPEEPLALGRLFPDVCDFDLSHQPNEHKLCRASEHWVTVVFPWSPV